MTAQAQRSFRYACDPTQFQVWHIRLVYKPFALICKPFVLIYTVDLLGEKNTILVYNGKRWYSKKLPSSWSLL